MTKFNKGMYAKMRGKKNEPLSNLGKRTVQVVEKGISVTPLAPVTEPSRMASPGTSVEEITPLRKKPRVDDKGRTRPILVHPPFLTMLALRWQGHKSLFLLRS